MVVLTFIFGLLPGFAWLIFYMTEDPHPEPKRMIILTFLAGIAFGFFTIAIENWWSIALNTVGVATLSVVSLLGLATIEECMKFCAAYFAVGKSEVLEEPIEHMLYMIVAALGFATLENLGAIATIPAQAAFIGAFFTTASFRFVGATLLHSLTSAVVGYHWAKGVARQKVALNITIGLVIATLLHALFNYLILSYGEIAYTVVLLVIVGFFVLNDFEELKTKKIPTATSWTTL